MGQITCIQLFQAQRQVRLNMPVFLASASDLVDWQLPGNLNYKILLELKKQLYSFNSTHFLDNWKEVHSSFSLNKIFNDALKSYDGVDANKIKYLYLQ